MSDNALPPNAIITEANRSALAAAAAAYSAPNSYPRPFLSIETIGFTGGVTLYSIREAGNFDEPLRSQIVPLVNRMLTLEEISEVFALLVHLPSLGVRFWENKPVNFPLPIDLEAKGVDTPFNP